MKEINEETKRRSTCILTEWVVGNLRPFKIIQDSGLKKFASFLISVGAEYGEYVNFEPLFPHPATLSRNLGKLYDKVFNKIKAELSEVKFGYAITTDMWTDNYYQMSYVAITIHYVKNGELKNSLLAMNAMEKERATGK